MPEPQEARSNRAAIIGRVFLALGSLTLIVCAAALAWQFHTAFSASMVDSLGFFPNLGMATFRLFRVVAFDHSALFSVGYRMLVIFSAFALLVLGAVLMRKSSLRAPGDARRAATSVERGL
jgi:hypothetical protein